MSGTYSLTARQLRAGLAPSGTPACAGQPPEAFFPEASDPGHGPSPEERAALAVCAVCPVRDWCLERDMEECTTEARVVGVRGGLRQADRRELFVARRGRRAPRRAGTGAGK
ncbi:WhiB family transcriptional regulator [Streptomyces sp. NPDC059783]|uniref:WhiB family transcriptional regulator n=1 Tax=Streptomyces sp. NPDC059783 TaxID=3346944 RepID=UPI00365B89FD